MFENIECEWPLFFSYLILDFFFQGNKDAAAEYTEELEEVGIISDRKYITSMIYIVDNDSDR